MAILGADVVFEAGHVVVRRMRAPGRAIDLSTTWHVVGRPDNGPALTVGMLEELWSAIDEELERVYAHTSLTRPEPERPYNRCGE